MALFRNQVIIELPETVEANNVLYCTIGDGQLGNDAATIAALDEWLTDLYTNLVALMPTIVTVARAIVYIVDTLSGDGTPFAEIELNIAGTDAGSMMPHGVSAKVDINVDGRSRPSSSYVCGLSVNEFGSSGLISAGAIPSLLNFATARTDNFVAANGIIIGPALWSQSELALFPLNGSSITINDVPDYQRRRKPGVGT